MQDLVIKGTGNSRYLKSISNFLTQYPTYEDFVAALVAGNLPIDFNGINSAGIQTQGTPLNKSTLLSDTTASKYGQGSSATVNSILNAIPSGSFPNMTAGWSDKTQQTDFSFASWTTKQVNESASLVVGGTYHVQLYEGQIGVYIGVPLIYVDSVKGTYTYVRGGLPTDYATILVSTDGSTSINATNWSAIESWRYRRIR